MSAGREQNRNPYSPIMIVVDMMAIVGVLAYGGFLLNPRNRGDFLPWSIVILCEVTLLAHALMAMWTMLSSTRSPRDYAFHSSKRLLYDMDVNERLGVSDDATKWPLHLGGSRSRSTSSSPSMARAWTRSGPPRRGPSTCAAPTTPGSSTTARPTPSPSWPTSWASATSGA